MDFKTFKSNRGGVTSLHISDNLITTNLFKDGWYKVNKFDNDTNSRVVIENLSQYENFELFVDTFDVEVDRPTYITSSTLVSLLKRIQKYCKNNEEEKCLGMIRLLFKYKNILLEREIILPYVRER